MILGFIRDAQLELIDDFGAKKQLIQSLRERVDSLKDGSFELASGACEVLFIVGQTYLLSGARRLTWDELTQILEKLRNTVRAYLEELEQQKLIERTSSRPLRVWVSESGKALLFPEHA